MNDQITDSERYTFDAVLIKLWKLDSKAREHHPCWRALQQLAWLVEKQVPFDRPEEFVGRKMLTMEEITQRLRVSKPTATKLIRNGKLKGRKIGRRWKVTENDLVEFTSQKKCDEP